MKKIIISVIIIFSTMNLYAQTDVDSLRYADDDATYRFFPAQNMWTFIKLDTRNGEMWQGQWSNKTKERLVIPIR